MKRFLSVVCILFASWMFVAPALSVGPFPSTRSTSTGIDTDGDGVKELNCDGTDCDFDSDDDGTVEAYIKQGSLYLLEVAAALADTATYGQFWVRNDVPNTPMFTDDAGNDFSMLNSFVMTGYGLNITAADEGECLRADSRSASSTCPTAGGNADQSQPYFGNVYLLGISCTYGSVQGEGAGDSLTVDVRWRKGGETVTDSTAALVMDISSVSSGDPFTTGTIREASPFADGWVNIHIKDFTDGDASITDADVVCSALFAGDTP